MIYTDEKIATMTKEEVVDAWQTDKYMLEHFRKKSKRLEEILAAIGIAYDTYYREYKQDNTHGRIG